jgi:hypothetical protein
MPQVDTKHTIKYVDPSGINKFNRCPFSYYLSRLEGYRDPKRNTIALDYGTCMHSALPHCFSGFTDKAKEIFANNWQDFGHEGQDKARNIERAYASLDAFADMHAPEFCSYEVVEFQSPDVVHKGNIDKGELPYLVNINGPLPLGGRIDLVVRLKESNQLWCVDFKTSAEISTRFWNGFHAGTQALAYTLALTILSDEKVHGLIVEAIRTSHVNAESMKGHNFVQSHMLDRFVEFANRTAAEILDCEETQNWPQKCSGCSTYNMFGQPGYYCDYKKVCDSVDWKSVLKFMKKEEPFHPFDMKDI